MGPDVTHSLTRLFADLTDMTLADDVNKAILSNVAMQVAPPDGQN